MLEDGPLTNSPISLSFASATLLSTPSSLATSCTRGFAATILLSGAHPGQGQALVADGTHFEPLIGCHSCEVNFFSLSNELRPDGRGVECSVDAERPPEGPALDRQVEALVGRMQPRTPPRPGGGRVRHEFRIEGDDPQKRGPGSARTASDARSDGFHLTPPGAWRRTDGPPAPPGYRARSPRRRLSAVWRTGAGRGRRGHFASEGP
jgi:hypothetical protein